ncbi:MAG: hypothetical protein NC078_02290 [Ruminococcus sp.]|nr:hypothetical protein [Ruminococcus sp.]
MSKAHTRGRSDFAVNVMSCCVHINYAERTGKTAAGQLRDVKGERGLGLYGAYKITDSIDMR